ncbi:sterol esterase [Sarracenia purpurea var. burkii]
MGAPSSLSLSALSLYALFLVWVSKPHQSYGFTGGIAVAPPSDGICATAVVIHGYKCQEFESEWRARRFGASTFKGELAQPQPKNGQHTQQPQLSSFPKNRRSIETDETDLTWLKCCMMAIAKGMGTTVDDIEETI